MCPGFFDEGVLQGIAGFFLLIIVVGVKAEVFVCVKGDTSFEDRDYMLLRLYKGVSEPKVARLKGSNGYLIAGGCHLLLYVFQGPKLIQGSP